MFVIYEVMHLERTSSTAGVGNSATVSISDVC